MVNKVPKKRGNGQKVLGEGGRVSEEAEDGRDGGKGETGRREQQWEITFADLIILPNALWRRQFAPRNIPPNSQCEIGHPARASSDLPTNIQMATDSDLRKRRVFCSFGQKKGKWDGLGWVICYNIRMYPTGGCYANTKWYIKLGDHLGSDRRKGRKRRRSWRGNDRNIPISKIKQIMKGQNINRIEGEIRNFNILFSTTPRPNL